MAGANARSFTNTAGKSIEAELVGVDDKTAMLKLSNGKKAKVPLSSLSADDQSYVTSWWEENKNKIAASDLRIKITKKTSPVKDSKEDDGKKKTGKSKTTSTVYTCTLNSYSKNAIEEITVDYTVYKDISTRGEDGSNSSSEEIKKTTTVKALEPNGSTEFQTEAVECTTSSQSSKNDKGSSTRESIDGIVISLSVGGKEFLKQSHPDNFLKQLEADEERQQRKK